MTNYVAASDGLLAGTAKEIGPALQQITDATTLQELAQAEQAGQGRSGVLTAITNRMGEVMLATPAAELAMSQFEADVLEVSREQVRETSQDILSVDGNAEIHEESRAITGGKVTHKGPRPKVLYFHSDEFGFAMPRIIAGQNVPIVIGEAGALPRCPDCRRDGCGVLPSGKLSGDPNECPGHPRIPYARCPVCEKKFFDFPFGNSKPVNESDGEVPIDIGKETSPAERIQGRIEQHMLNAHQQEARSLGVLAERPRAGAS